MKIDANVAKKNVLQHRDNSYKDFIKANKDRLNKILKDIEKLSLVGKRELHADIPEKYIEQAKIYMLGLGFGVHILRHVNSKDVGIIEQSLRITW